MSKRLAFALCILLSAASAATAAELKILSPIALKPLLTKVTPGFEAKSGDKVVIVWGESGGIRSSIEKGEPFDIAILTPNFVDSLTKQGKLDSAASTQIARSGIGIVVRKGAPKPDVSTLDAFKRTLLAAKSIGFVEHSATSRYIETLIARLRLEEAVKPKLKPLPGPVHEFIPSGEPEIALSQVPAFLQFDTVELAGPLPAEIQLYTTFVANAPPGARPAVHAFIKAMASPDNVATLKAAGFEPAL